MAIDQSIDANFKVEDLERASWDKIIAADIAVELEHPLAEKASTIPEMRRFLAIKGLRELRKYLEQASLEKAGAEALRAVCLAMRSFAVARPGLSAAAFRNPGTEAPEWRGAIEAVDRTVLWPLSECGIEGETAQQALRAFRALARGFVLHEMAISFTDAIDYEESYRFAVNLLIRGLKDLHRA
jgi:hypothetical protein